MVVENKYRERIAEYLGYMQRDPFTFGMGTPGYLPGLEIVPKQLQVREMIFHDFGLLHGIIHVPRRKYQHRKTYQPYVRGYLESREVPASQFTNRLTVERFANLFGIPNITFTRITDEVWMQTVEAFNSLPWVKKPCANHLRQIHTQVGRHIMLLQKFQQQKKVFKILNLHRDHWLASMKLRFLHDPI